MNRHAVNSQSHSPLSPSVHCSLFPVTEKKKEKIPERNLSRNQGRHANILTFCTGINEFENDDPSCLPDQYILPPPPPPDLTTVFRHSTAVSQQKEKSVFSRNSPSPPSHHLPRKSTHLSPVHTTGNHRFTAGLNSDPTTSLSLQCATTFVSSSGATGVLSAKPHTPHHQQRRSQHSYYSFSSWYSSKATKPRS